MTATARDVVDELLDARAEIVGAGGEGPRVDVIDRLIARIGKRLAVPPPEPRADRDELQRFALLLLDLRDRALARTCTHDAAALLRVAQLIANERRLSP